LQKELRSLEANHVRLVTISYDSVETLAQVAESRKLTFPLLSDPDSKVIKEFRLLNKEAIEKSVGSPYPGTVLVDKDGVIRAKLFHDNVFQRASTADILKAADQIK
jgi:peroxiredoxin